MTNFLTKKHDIPFPPSLSHCAGLRFSVVQKLIQDSDLQRVSRGLNHVCVSSGMDNVCVSRLNIFIIVRILSLIVSIVV